MMIPKIWQEQVGVSQAGSSTHTFLRTTQTISPSTRSQDGSDQAFGCVSILFDPSSVLVATRLDDSPGTVWIWDLQAAELRAILLFHGSINGLSWHPTIRETLLIRCEGDQYNGVVFVWDPLSEGPRSVDFSQHLPTKVTGKSRALWLGRDTSISPSLFLSDAQNYVLASLIELDQGSPPWGDGIGVTGLTGNARGAMREESPLELVPAADNGTESLGLGQDEDDSELEDTFIHKR
jgi:WD40 repeat protein